MGRSKQTNGIHKHNHHNQKNEAVEKMHLMLGDLRKSIFKVQEERSHSEHTLMSSYLRQKLKGLYCTAMQDAQAETTAIRDALRRITDIKQFLSQRVQLSQPKEKLRRGVLLSILQQSANSLPLWVGELGEESPPLSGSKPAPTDYIPQVGDKIAARVKNNDGEENWILATITNHWPSTNRFEVEDVDEGNEKYRIARSKVLPLPIYKANPETDPDALFQVGDDVLALYPQTTCFYHAIVHKRPERATDNYQLQFEDDSYPEGFSPPLQVGQRYVVNLPGKKKR
ncbi:DgyrCDS9422 [Dimorphilus gyrociliatus]|uniref:DgyrCDS9422 n=1 Tax=Dimorphilus gyrociliatus TaxID=2664684 RepID=A0A7I8VYM6_9ANNE|nr:DgyrCDS9422 [Dimorphilus gyrociliatus]